MNIHHWLNHYSLRHYLARLVFYPWIPWHSSIFMLFHSVPGFKGRNIYPVLPWLFVLNTFRCMCACVLNNYAQSSVQALVHVQTHRASSEFLKMPYVCKLIHLCILADCKIYGILLGAVWSARPPSRVPLTAVAPSPRTTGATARHAGSNAVWTLAWWKSVSMTGDPYVFRAIL